MTDSIHTGSNDPRDPAAFAITEPLPGRRLRDNANGCGTPVTEDDDHKARIDKALDRLIVAESWESMALQSAARFEPHADDPTPSGGREDREQPSDLCGMSAPQSPSRPAVDTGKPGVGPLAHN